MGEQFRSSSAAWSELATALLPDQVPLFKETRELLMSKRDLFVQEGGAAIGEIQGIDQRLEEIRASVAEEFPMSAEAVTGIREALAERVKKISEIEREAITALQKAMA